MSDGERGVACAGPVDAVVVNGRRCGRERSWMQSGV